MTRLEKVLNDRAALREYVLEHCCPHDFKIKDTYFSLNGCQMSCDDCWNKKVE
jgi:hypothetical protein